jgi:multiple sugar transport system ATP-binding protein
VASIELERIEKVYSNGYKAVDDVTLQIPEGEFMVLVGPSGCGKTTLLRMVAGLEKITAGTLKIGGKVVNNATPKERDIAMVFQNYALYPHMSVQNNIGFSLRLRGVAKGEVRDKVGDAAGVLGLSEWLDRKPAQLSGGQRQRVAMGRAMVRQPNVFLMDEPLSNLDAKLRVQMRTEVSRIQRQLNVATIYVTHDQVEAMTMGDRVAVMNHGVVQQCADPQTLYDSPVNLFVASFIGSPSMNLYEATLEPGGGALKIGQSRIELAPSVHTQRPTLISHAGQEVVVGLRPEHLTASDRSDPGRTVEGEVDLVEALGNELQVHFTLDAKRVLAEGSEVEDELSVVRGEGVARVDPRVKVTAGSRMPFVVDTARMHFFDPATGLAIRD